MTQTTSVANLEDDVTVGRFVRLKKSFTALKQGITLQKGQGGKVENIDTAAGIATVIIRKPGGMGYTWVEIPLEKLCSDS